jgi:hypothetical protein
MPQRLLALLVLGSAACLEPEMPATLTGEWGGEHLGLVASVQGADLEFDCATARISTTIQLDRDGRFSVAGLHFPGHGGPSRDDEETVEIPARFDGTVRGNLMTISVTLTSWATTLGPFTLKRGASPNVFKCL